MKACRNRSLSLLLLLCIVMCTLSFSVFANPEPEKAQSAGTDYAAGAAIDQDVVTTEMKEKAGQGIVEIESLREESSKHFQLEDGSYQAIAYGAAVHRMDADGKWRDIDNRLYADRTESGRYSTRDGRFSFAESVSADELYIIDDGQYRISFGALLEGSPRSTAVIENHADRKTAAEGLTGEEKLEALKTIDNATRIKYYSVNDGVDLEYIISGNDVKENIIISQPTTKSVFTYRLKLIGLSAELEDNTISLKNKDGETVYLLTAPYMYDSAGAESAKVAYALEKDNEGCVITIDADSDWINDPERVFPVTVDPSVTSVLQDDTYTYTYYPSTNYGSSTVLYVDSKSITYMKSAMPTIPTYADITAASLNVRYYYNGTSNGTTIGLYRCMRDWDENTLTYFQTHLWLNRGLSQTSTDTKTTPAGSISASNPSLLSFNILSLARQWYAEGTNYGIGLKYEGGTDICVMLYSYEAPNPYKSYFEITYTNNSNPIVQNGTYFIKNKSTNLYIDDYHNTTEGGLILQYSFTGVNEQRWVFRYAHWGNYYTIKTANNTSDYFMGVDGDSTSANADIVFRQGLDTNGTRTMSDGMLWEITTTASGAYKFQAITGQSGSNNLVMHAAPYTGSSIDIGIKQISYTNNTDYKDEWYLYRYYGELDYWNSDEVRVSYWSNSPKIYSEQLETAANFYYLSGLLTAKSQWQNALNITLIDTNNMNNADIKSYGLNASQYFGLTGYTWNSSYAGLTSFSATLISYASYGGVIKEIHKLLHATVYIIYNPSNPKTEAVTKDTVTHELGHALGYIGHSPTSTDVMFKSVHSNYTLSDNEINHLSQIYQLIADN